MKYKLMHNGRAVVVHNDCGAWLDDAGNVYDAALEKSADIVYIYNEVRMKTLSVRESWAYYIVAGLKDVENRTWQTAYRGPLLIHASGDYQGVPDPIEVGDKCLPVGCDYFRVCGIAHKTKTMGQFWQKTDDGGVSFKAKKSERLPDEIEREWAFWDRIFTSKPPYCPTRAVIGMVELVDVVRDSKSPWAQAGQFHWILKNAEWFKKPILGITGKLGLFELDENIIQKGR